MIRSRRGAVKGMITLFEEAKREQARVRNRRYRAAHPEARKESTRRYRDANREKVQAANRRYMENHPEAVDASRRRWIDANPTGRSEANRRWAAQNLDKRANNRATRRARLAQVLIEVVDRTLLYDRDQGICQLCLLPVDREAFQVDHVVPIARGGEHSYANTQIAHPRCNQSKGMKI